MYGPVCTVVWEEGSRKAPPYPDWVGIWVRPGSALMIFICFVLAIVSRLTV